MVRWSALQTLSTPAGTTTFVTSPTAARGLLVDPAKCTGGGMGKVRAAIDNKAQASGYLLHPEWFEEGTHFVVGGTMLGTVAEVDADADALETQLRSILSATGTLSFGSYGSATVRCDLEASFPTISATLKGFVFGVVSASPF